MVIRKRINLDFLGDEYKEAYFVFASIPVSEWPEINKTIDAEDNGVKKTGLMHDKIRSKFIEGKYPNDKGELQDISADELELDAEVLTVVYNRLMGVDGDPKVSMPSETS